MTGVQIPPSPKLTLYNIKSYKYKNAADIKGDIKTKISNPFIIFPRTLESGRIVYYYRVRQKDGNLSWAKSCGTSKKTEAYKIVKSLFLSDFPDDQNVTFKTFTKGFFDSDSEYCKWRKANSRAITESTLITYRMKLNFQLLPFFKDYNLTDISIDLLKKWVVWACELWSIKTVNNAQGVLNIILQSAVEKNIIEKNPLDKISFRKLEKKSRDLLTVEEIKQIYNYPHWMNEKGRSAFLLAVITGMRIGEICALEKTSIKNNCLDVKQSFSEKTGLGDTKTKAHRFVPILNNFPFPESKSKWIFEKNGEPLPPHIVYNSFIKVCKTLGIDVKNRGITLHTTRNFFISFLMGKNVPEVKIKAVVGHADKSITDAYTYWKPEMYSEVYKLQEELYKEIICEKENKNNILCRQMSS